MTNNSAMRLLVAYQESSGCLAARDEISRKRGGVVCWATACNRLLVPSTFVWTKSSRELPLTWPAQCTTANASLTNLPSASELSRSPSIHCVDSSFARGYLVRALIFHPCSIKDCNSARPINPVAPVSATHDSDIASLFVPRLG